MHSANALDINKTFAVIVLYIHVNSCVIYKVESEVLAVLQYV